MLYGTAWKEERTETLVSEALADGFRAIDSANQRKHYFESATGKAVQTWLSTGHGKREDLFIQTKFTYRDGQDHRLPYDPAAPIQEQVRQSFESSLKNFGFTYFDSLLIHGPERRDRLTENDWQVWKELERIYDEKRVRAIGISNASAAQVEELWLRSRVKPSFVQNRCYPMIAWDPSVRAVCLARGIVYQAFSLVREEWLRAPALAAIARSLGDSVTEAQVLYAYAWTSGLLPMTGTTNALHRAQAWRLES